MPTVDHNKIVTFLSTNKNLNRSQIEAIWAIIFSGLIKKRNHSNA